ncbi:MULTISPECIES: hypothetical protein [unclassified Caballeronia]|uniref:hypothetical protein n=1 Tax=unclassified Caballeronia TaxID=2646786 RepID=UPI002865226B|nr:MULTISPECIES: hypothetical protein [unclassified Caballeronia]MDR5777596.1 hypothetical protein [Caballeronia sp. LZ002]MDR5802352.1 hypothetical protein [Caballeronia sp. LZ001]MDR5853030.1 hypothetical protein [Caballeronia sp. LZ003]
MKAASITFEARPDGDDLVDAADRAAIDGNKIAGVSRAQGVSVDDVPVVPLVLCFGRDVAMQKRSINVSVKRRCRQSWTLPCRNKYVAGTAYRLTAQRFSPLRCVGGVR